MTLKLTPKEARRLTLATQGLCHRPDFGRGERAVVRAMERIGYVQIDTISVVNRAHHHVIWSRVPDFRPDTLFHLQKKRHVFEYWSHAAAFLPIKSYRFTLPVKQRISRREKHWFERDHRLLNHVFTRIKEEGPLMARDFEPVKTSGQMWDIKPAKMALHELFMQGRIMIESRSGFQKRYDLPERVLPSDVDCTMPCDEAFIDFLIFGGIRALGLIREAEIVYLRRGWRDVLKRRLDHHLASRRLRRVAVHDQVYYTTEQQLAGMPKRMSRASCKFISPFDNAIIQRKRLLALFGFCYQIEIYLAKDKRRFGYFSMPILWGDRFVGRINPKADRKTRTLWIRNLHLEQSLRDDTRFQQVLTRAIEDYATFNGCDRIECCRADYMKDCAGG